MMGLTQKQAETLYFIEQNIRVRGRVPSRVEIAAGIGIASKGRANLLVDALVEKGYLRRMPKRARSLEVVNHNCPHCGHDLKSAHTPGAAALAVDKSVTLRRDSERTISAVSA